MMKFCLFILFSMQHVLVIGQMDIPADLFESDAEKEYRTLNPHQSKPDSNYVNYWCSSEILLNTHDNFETLSLSDIADFLATFHPSCFNNTEFSEWSNEMLFKVFIHYPQQTLEILTKE